MITVHHTKPSAIPYWFIMILLFLTLGKYGWQAIEWIMLKLYEFFIQNHPVSLF